MKLQDIATKPEQATPQYSQAANNMSNKDNANQDNNQQVSQGNQDDSTKQTSSDDLLSRVTKFIDDNNPANKSDDDIDSDVFNDAKFREKIESLNDPELKQYMLSMRKSGVRGIQERLQEIAEMRKELQSLKQGINPNWTPERVQHLLNDQDFLKAAQSILGTDSSQQFSDEDEYIPESVKKQIETLRQENAQFKQQWNQFNQKQFQSQLQQEHSRLKEKYGNYDDKKINELMEGLIKGEVQAGPEVIYKAYFHDDNVKRAYEMGRRDALNGNSEKVQSSSFDTNSFQKPVTELKPEKNESNRQFMQRVIANNLSKFRK